MVDRKQPYSEEAEQSVLGAMALDRDALARVAEMINKDDFYRQAHGMIYQAMVDLYNQDTPVDAVTLSEELRNRGELDKAGGPAYLVELLEGVPTAANARDYAEIVKENSLRRNMIRAGTEIVSRGYEEGQVAIDELLDRAQRDIFTIAEKRHTSEFIHMKDLVPGRMEQIDKLFDSKGAITGLPTGYDDLDNLTGGLQAGDLIILASRPSMGKTSLALNIARHVALNVEKGKEKQRPVIFFSLEMSAEALAMRLVCAEARVSMHDIRQGFLSREKVFTPLANACGRLYEAPILVNDSGNVSALEISAKARRIHREHNISIIVIDYLQMMQTDSRKSSDTHEREIAITTRALKGLAKEIRVPILLLSQLNRRCEERENKRPILSDLRDSGAIEQDADLVAFIYREVMYDKETPDRNVAELIIAKHRNGPLDDIKLTFLEKFARFESFSARPAPKSEA